MLHFSFPGISVGTFEAQRDILKLFQTEGTKENPKIPKSICVHRFPVVGVSILMFRSELDGGDPRGKQKGSYRMDCKMSTQFIF